MRMFWNTVVSLVAVALLFYPHIFIYHGDNIGVVFHTDYIYCGIEFTPDFGPFCGDY